MHTEDSLVGADAAVGTDGAAPGGRRQRRWPAVTAAVVVLLLVLGVGANVWATRYTKDAVVRVLRCVTGDESLSPTVSLGETPLLMGLVSRTVDRITISGLSTTSIAAVAAPATAAGDTDASSGIPLGSLTVTLTGVGLGDPPTMDSAHAALTLPFDGLSGKLTSSADPEDAGELNGASLTAQDGLLAVTLAEKVGGRPVKVLVRLEPGGDTLTATPESVVVGGRTVGVGLVSLLTGDLLQDENGESRLKPRTVDLGLPAGTTLETVGVRPEGLALGLAVDPAQVSRAGTAGRDCLA
ncbi:hypothetical protein [Kineosporia succinea]|uniref:DUF2993 family protein n=1 Tax=Kineosporia succinea TaxID=84632 RepID=A0ABT9P0M5_9ACTN|nr:hypothetical protein [Kineosporia succinea]MDP9826126.1 hypothetical protein [Kineosporia succinea]